MDLLSRRYSVLPSELKNLTPSDFQFNLLVMNAGLKFETESAEKARRKAARGRRR